MRIDKPTKLEWRAIAVDDDDPGEFVAHLQATFQMLSDGGYNVLAQMTRGTAHIIIAHRLALAPEPAAEPAAAADPTLAKMN